MKTFYKLLTIFFVVVEFSACSTTVSSNEDDSSNNKDRSSSKDSVDQERLLFTKQTGMETYACKGAYAGKSINIYYHIPNGSIKNMPVQIIMHGMDRNGDKYRDDWKDLANQYGFIVLAPQFSEDEFSENAYQRGNVQNESGVFVSQDSMIYPIISEVFHYFIDNSGSQATKYNIYGHSAGAQFVHRYLLFNKTPEVDRAIAANAGWYTIPTDTIDYPYGIGQSADQIGTDIAAYYQKNLIILLGDADTLRTESLNQSKKADAQGLTRLERGNNFFEFSKADAASRDTPFHWEKSLVEGVGHSDSKMAPYAAKLLYGEK